MGPMLVMEKGGNAAERKVLSQADLNAVAEQGMQVFQHDGNSWTRLRVRRELGKDNRVVAGGTYEIDLWEPIMKVDPQVEEAAKKANESDAAAQGLNLEANSVSPAQLNPVKEPEPDNNKFAQMTQGQHVSPQEIQAADMNKHHPALKDAAARMAAGNALGDTANSPHDGQPGRRSSTPEAPTQEQLREMEERSNPNGGTVSGGASERSKPASPSPKVTPSGSQIPGSASAPKELIHNQSRPNEGKKNG